MIQKRAFERENVMDSDTKEVYSEICEFLDLLSDNYKNKIPNEMLRLFEENKSKDYIQHINPNIPIEEQKLKDETLTLISILYLKYWCKDEKEKENLKQVYINNEIKYQNELKEKYDMDIFQNKKVNKNSDNLELIEYKKISIFRKFIILIKRFLRK